MKSIEEKVSDVRLKIRESQSRRFYMLRIIGCACGFLAVSPTFHHLDVPAVYWLYAIIGCFAWPHIAYFMSIRSRDTNRAEKRNCMIETFLGGILVPLMSFNLLPGSTLFAMVSMNNIGLSGVRFSLKGVVAFFFGILVVIPFTGTQIIFKANASVILSCIPALIFYPQLVAWMAFALARDLNKTRGTLEQQYRKLAEANIKIRDQRDLLDNISKLDGLTGIPNRRHFDEYLEKQWQSLLRSNSVLSVLMIDIDHFKEYNDNYGHGKGDACLKQVAETLSRSVKRPNDMLARYGGDEFICALPGTDSGGAKKIAEEMRNNIMSLAIPHFHSSAADYVTISLGMATIQPAISVSVRRLLKAADQALYRAKNNSRNCTEFLKSA